MPVLFVSHSSRDESAAKSLENWLHGHGFTDTFIDYRNIAGGDKWAQALRDASAACRVVVCLVTEHWLASDECFGEFRAASYMGKRIIPLLALPRDFAAAKERLAKVLAEDQGLNVGSCLDANGHLDLARDPDVEARLQTGLRAAGALARIGLDPEAFAVDRGRRPLPFPGLTSFGDDDADAALFYGRSREVAQVLDALRQMRAVGERRPLIILGASGAGKSSLLKAGIIPRLRREVPAWLPLRAFRPGADPLLNFSEALARTLADFGKAEAHGAIRDRLLDTWSKAERDANGLSLGGRAALEAALESEGRTLRNVAGRAEATILISIDQAEELARSDGMTSEALADYLRAGHAAASSGWQLAFTIRTDSFPELQSHHHFQDLEARGYDLRAIPGFRFGSVIEEPAKRYGVSVEHALVDALMDDAPEEDALPLLAFALQRLWRQYAASGVLTKDNYARLGGLRGLIEDAAERALRGLRPQDDVPLSSGQPPLSRIDLAASAFVPALTQINDQGVAIRRIAPWSSFDADQQKLLDWFDQWRLVVRRGDPAGGTVEVAHDALFREWSRLKSWLEPERARLETLRAFQVDALTWDRNGREQAFLNHRDKRLAEAAALTGIEAYRRRFHVHDFDYLAACQAAERLQQKQARRARILVGTLLVGIAAGIAGWSNEAYLRERYYWFRSVRPYVLTAQAEQALKPKDAFRECAEDCPEMIVVPAGSYMMGAAEHGYFREDDQHPQHEVVFAGPFAVSKLEITFEQWDACVRLGGCVQASDGGYGRGKLPVIFVSWRDAKQYVAWLSKLTGQTYRLLSEAEWEYAARAGTTTKYPWGDEVGIGNANCDGCGSPWDAKSPAPVGSFPPNEFGLHDMNGNVWEWVEDSYHPNYDEAPQDGSVWSGGDPQYRVLRGGSWSFSPESLRCVLRNSASAVDRHDYIGFRIARTLLPAR